MPSSFRNPTNLPDWIELDYTSRPRGLRRGRWLLSILALVVCVAGVLVASRFPGSKKLLQAAPVSSAHTLFNDDCGKCHEQAFATARRVLPWKASVPSVTDRACRVCHEGPPHNQQVRTEDERRCAVCHREHRGRATLARVPDGECTGCHADLKNHRKDGSKGLAFENVTAFYRDHPEFRLPKIDNARLKFNHHKHLELAKKETAQMKPMALALSRLRQQGCAACHQQDDTGRFMRPVQYEKHCADCHPLSVQLAGDFKGPDQPALDRAVQKFNSTPAPHAAPLVVRGVLRERLLDLVRRFPLEARLPNTENRLIDPGVLGKRLDPGRPPSDAEWTWVNRALAPMEKVLFSSSQLDLAEQRLFGQACVQCHFEEGRGKKDELPGLPVYEKTNVPKRWLAHARFSHGRHRMLSCVECHPVAKSTLTRDVLMPRLKNCRECHNPTAGVRSDCVECHQYHH
jgi:hypothetical protein